MKPYFAILATFAACNTLLFAQGGGKLTPPGAPAPTMKSLQEIEPRTPLIEGAADTAAVTTSDADAHFVINQTGSYYLTGNLNATKSNGIVIQAEGVTLDLSGFTVGKVGGPEGIGVNVADGSLQCTVKNGRINGFNTGLDAYGFGSGNPVGGTAQQIVATNCLFDGIKVDRWKVTGCQADGNSNAGIVNQTGGITTNCSASTNGVLGIIGSVIIGCTASDNEGGGISGSVVSNCRADVNDTYGISGTVVTSCTARVNGADGIRGVKVTQCSASRNGGDGIAASASGATFTDCSANDNDDHGFHVISGSTITSCTALENGLDGFNLSGGSTVTGCTAKDNTGDGIEADTHCFIQGNLSDGNTGFGIHTTGIRNRIDGNQVTRNDVGIKVDAATSLIIRNTATGNTPNWQIAANNNVGAIVVPTNSPAINGNSGGSGVTTTDPWANFSY